MKDEHLLAYPDRALNFSVRFNTLSQVQYINSMLTFIIISGKAKPAIMGHETLAVSKIASACEESARTQQFVQLKWEPDDIPPN
jgi:myo-inositol 2-dehydrogenase/D-chiro-inositol 1-dehydrogenase